MKRSLTLLIATTLAASLTSACGTGIILFDPSGDGPTGKLNPNTQSFDIDCKDAFADSGGTTAMGARAGSYEVSCTYQGKPLPWKTLGVFHAAPAAKGSWDKYRAAVLKKARAKGCPGVAIRTTPPTENQEGEATGALCVDPGGT
jgi:hypothetical protein